MAEILIDVKNLEKQYGRHKVLKGTSFQVEKGQIVGLIGPNGAGKTTIMKILGGLVLPTEGTYSLFGEKTEEGLAKSRSRMSFIVEAPYLKSGMSARDNLEKIRIMKGIPDKKRVDEVLALVGLSDVGKKTADKFSLGMRQRLGIAIALLSKPELMVLDEPINGLDLEGIVEIRELLLKLNQEEDITIVISSHILSELSLLCTDYVFVHHGEIIQEVSAEELKRLSKEHYRIHTDNDALALAILQEKLAVEDVDVEENGSIRLYEQLDNVRMVSKTLYEGGVIPLSLEMKEANLEEYYMEMVGEQNVESGKSTALSNAKK